MTLTATALTQSRTSRRGRRNWTLLTGIALLSVLVAAALAVPWLTGVGVNEQSANSFASASTAHPFGTDEVGRDIFARTFHGLRVDLLLIFAAVPVSLALGTVLGMLRVFGTVIGEVDQRVVDIILGFPAIILGISVVAVLGSGFPSLWVAIVIAGIPPFGRLARSSLVTLEGRDFITAAKSFGVPARRLLTRHYVPNAATPLLTQLAISLVSAVALEASLSVVGLGLQPPTPSLGGLVSDGLRNVYSQIWYVLGPTLVLIALAMALSLLADGAVRGRNRS